MSRLDRYYIPPGVPARPPAPPLPRKGILMMPPPPPPTSAIPNSMLPMSNTRYPPDPTTNYPSSINSNWSYKPTPSMQQHMSLPLMTSPPPPPLPVVMFDKIRPAERMARRPLPRLARSDYEELGRDSTNLATALTIPDANPRMALQRILVLYENGEHREAAAFMRRLSFQTFKQLLPQLPADIFIESMPHSLPILETLYAKMYYGGDGNKLIGRANSLRPEAVVWQLVKFFASQEEGLNAAGQMRWEFCGPFISSCKRLLSVLMSAEPRIRRIVTERKKALMKAIEGLGQHGPIGTSDEQLMNLHCALKVEFDKVQKRYGEAIQNLEVMSLLNGKNGKGTISSTGKAPIAQSHQRQLSLKAMEIQERLIKNKTLLNVVEPTLENTPLEVLLGILQKRIELDKECLFQFTQIKKEANLKESNQSVAPILMRHQRGCQQVLDLMQEVSEDKDEGDCSDISGYHSDSESAVMTSGNSPFISKEERYHFLTRSVRLGSKHNVRASILASSLCLDSASLRDGSIKGSLGGPPSLVLHSSSGVSSGTSSDTASNEDKSESPTPSSVASNATVKRQPLAGPGSTVSARSAQPPRPRHLKQRKEVYKTNSTTGSVKTTCSKCGEDEPLYQGIVERDISVIRKETEITALQKELAKLKLEMAKAQKTVFELQDNEKRLKDVLASEKHRTLTLEKMAGKSGANYGTSIDKRPSALVKRYGELYSQMRLETLDALDKLPQLVNSDELKSKLLFSVMVLAFRSVLTLVEGKRDQIRRILQLPPPPTPGTPASEADPAAIDLEEAMSTYLRRGAENFDLSKNVEEVCTQIWATLYDYPCLKTCDGIIRYIKECVRVAWGLVNQFPSYQIEYETRQFRPDLHVRFHASDPKEGLIKTYLWPALLEGKEGPCVQKGVVIT